MPVTRTVYLALNYQEQIPRAVLYQVVPEVCPVQVPTAVLVRAARVVCLEVQEVFLVDPMEAALEGEAGRWEAQEVCPVPTAALDQGACRVVQAVCRGADPMEALALEGEEEGRQAVREVCPAPTAVLDRGVQEACRVLGRQDVFQDRENHRACTYSGACRDFQNSGMAYHYKTAA